MKESPEICIALHCAFQSGACVFDSQCFAALQVNSEQIHTYNLFLKNLILNKPLPPSHSSFFFHCIDLLCMKTKYFFANFRFQRKWMIFEIKHEITTIDILRFWIIVIPVKLENVTELIRIYKIYIDHIKIRFVQYCSY